MILVNLCAEISCSNNHRENSMSFYLLKSESIKLPLAVKTLRNFTVLIKIQLIYGCLVNENLLSV